MISRGNRALRLVVPPAFALSGASALVFQAVLNKHFSFIFGVSAYATSAVLASFMFGLALGSALASRVVLTWRRPLLVYALAEVSIGLYALAFTALAGQVQVVYQQVASAWQLGFGAVTAWRILAAAVLVGVPTTLMGASLPFLLEGLRRRGVSGVTNLLYGLNTVGAATGALGSAYLLMPALGLSGSLVVVFALDLLVGLLVLPFSAEVGGAAQSLRSTAEPAAAGAPLGGGASLPVSIALLAFFSGWLTFVCEVVWTHLLALVAGTSTYAYAIMLFSTLFAMSLGGGLAHGLKRRRGAAADLAWSTRHIALALAAFAGLTWVTLPVWDDVPSLFLAAAPVATSFWAMEAVRFVSCFGLLLLPATAAGVVFPLVLSHFEHDAKGNAVVGRLYAVNTAGTIAGSLLSGFVLLRLFGGRGTLLLVAAASAAVAAWLLSRHRRALAAGVAGLVGASAWAVVPRWHDETLLSGANIYFSDAHDRFEELVWQRESLTGGVTSVVRRGNELTMLTDGKFQGNDGKELKDQRRFAMIPHLFVPRKERALNIGLGTGTTLGVLTTLGYGQVDAVELSDDVVEAARRFFAKANHGALEHPSVTTHLEDGRNFLALRPKAAPYDLVSIEITSIWFAGAGNLYNDEFYALAAEHLGQQGVLQQWLQLHHMSVTNVASIVRTLRKRFRYVQLWVPSHQGVLIASQSPLTVRPERLAELESSFGAEDFHFGWPSTLLGELLLDADGTDAFLASQPAAPLSTDDNLFLEYATPRGNALGWNFDETVARLERFACAPGHCAFAPGAESLTPMRLGRAWFAPEHGARWHAEVAAALDQASPAERARALPPGPSPREGPAPVAGGPGVESAVP